MPRSIGLPLEIHGEIKYVDAPDIEPGVVKILPTGSPHVQHFLRDTVSFILDSPVRVAGWYEDPEYPVREGHSPVFVNRDGRAFIPVTPTRFPNGVPEGEYVEQLEGRERLVPLFTK